MRPQRTVNSAVGLSKCIVIAAACCDSLSDAGSSGFSENPDMQLSPGQSPGGYRHVDELWHARNVCGPTTNTLLSGSRRVYDVKPPTSTSSCPLLSRSNTENTNLGKVTFLRVLESSNANVRFTYVPDWIDNAPNRPLQPPYPSVYLSASRETGERARVLHQ